MANMNLLVPSYNLYRYNLEKMEKETGNSIRTAVIPWHYNDASMCEFFASAYPSIFSMDEGVHYDNGFHYFSKEHEKLFRSSRDKLYPAKELSYQNAMILGREDNFPSNTGSEASDMIERIKKWFTPDVQTVIDLSGLQHQDKEKNIKLFKKHEQVLEIIKELAVFYDSKLFFYDPFGQIPSMAEKFSWTEEALGLPKAVDFIKGAIEQADQMKNPSELIKACDKQHEQCLINYLR